MAGLMAPSATAPLIEWLGDAIGDAATLGGKAASLDRLARMGFRIPPGFCLTTTAFRRQLGDADVEDDGDGTAARIAGQSLEPELAAGLRDAVTRLTAEAPAPSFAVRSSAIGE